jgi:hypothetical protein
LAPFYSEVGRPSIDPELMIRMLIVGYCYGVGTGDEAGGGGGLGALMADTVKKAGALSFDDPIWNEIIAPNISGLKRAEMTSLTIKKPSLVMFAIWAATFLNIETATRVRLFNFIRKAISAVDAFELARTHYDRLFSSNNIDEYFSALRHFENCLAAAYQGHEVLFGIRSASFFNNATKRGQLNERIRHLYNRAKHVEGFIRRSGFDGDVIPVWITNDGLATRSNKLSFQEIDQILADMCDAANLITTAASTPASDEG